MRELLRIIWNLPAMFCQLAATIRSFAELEVD